MGQAGRHQGHTGWYGHRLRPLGRLLRRLLPCPRVEQVLLQVLCLGLVTFYVANWSSTGACVMDWSLPNLETNGIVNQESYTRLGKIQRLRMDPDAQQTKSKE